MDFQSHQTLAEETPLKGHVALNHEDAQKSVLSHSSCLAIKW